MYSISTNAVLDAYLFKEDEDEKDDAFLGGHGGGVGEVVGFEE